MSAAVKDHLKFAASVAVVIVVIHMFQKKVYPIPVVGPMLPGGQ